MRTFAQLLGLFCCVVFAVSCSSPTSSSKGNGGGTGAGQYALSATVDGVPFSAAGTATFAKYIDTSKYLVDIKGTSAALGQSMEITFLCPSFVSSALTLRPGNSGSVTGQYFGGPVGSSTVWTSGDTASVTVNSFSIGPTDTTLSINFSFTAWGGASGAVETVKKISLGTILKN
jgi:hypothetical protein